MISVRDCISRVDIIRTDPFVATLTFETDYSQVVFRVSRDIDLEKYWVQMPGRYKAVIAVVERISEIDSSEIAQLICDNIHHDRARGLGGFGVEVTAAAEDAVHLHQAWDLRFEDLQAFAQHVIEEMGTRYVPSFEEVDEAVADGLRTMGKKAGAA
ncbi:hypothetical protein HFO84_35640 [Rhizobium leguminosarum]|uniref:hypothetical protein n=1 Tax=Rhizobium leguminosarum TaxID=384 RepID=UPI001C9677E1|nr:hypothetical protein [Rhizobium leguminosarum]MBY5482606.1 hypothetical protein [Rhizobium leguminosarum]